MKRVFKFILVIIFVSLLVRGDIISWEAIDGCEKLTVESTVYHAICQKCFEGYNLQVSSGTCIYDETKCIRDEGRYSCSHQYCQEQQDHYNVDSQTVSEVCQACVKPYQPFIKKCMYYCQQLNKYLDYATECKPNCSTDLCLRCSVDNSFQCEICQESIVKQNGQCVKNCAFGFYFSGSCITNCPDGYYFSSINGKTCLACSKNCLRCSSQYTCITCKAEFLSPPTCSCLNGQYIHSTGCVSKCPYPFYPNFKNICIKLCSETTFPIFSSDGSFEKCLSIISQDDYFCINSLSIQSDKFNIKIYLSKESEVYKLIVSLPVTLSQCLEVKLFGLDKHQQIFPTTDPHDFQGYTMSFRFKPTDSYVQCINSVCLFNLETYSKLTLKYKHFIYVDVSNSLIQNTLTYFASTSIICDICIPPLDLIVPATFNFECGDNQICSGNKIITPRGKRIVFTQKVENNFSQKSIKPYFMRLYTNAASTINPTFTEDFIYYNSVLGQITYTLKDISISTDILLTSYILESKQRLLESVSSTFQTFYTQTNFSIIIIESSSGPNDDGSSNKIQIILYILIPLCLFLGFGAGIFFYKRKNKPVNLHIPIGLPTKYPQLPQGNSHIPIGLPIEYPQLPQVKTQLPDSIKTLSSIQAFEIKINTIS